MLQGFKPWLLSDSARADSIDRGLNPCADRPAGDGRRGAPQLVLLPHAARDRDGPHVRGGAEGRPADARAGDGDGGGRQDARGRPRADGHRRRLRLPRQLPGARREAGDARASLHLVGAAVLVAHQHLRARFAGARAHGQRPGAAARAAQHALARQRARKGPRSLRRRRLREPARLRGRRARAEGRRRSGAATLRRARPGQARRAPHDPRRPARVHRAAAVRRRHPRGDWSRRDGRHHARRLFPRRRLGGPVFRHRLGQDREHARRPRRWLEQFVIRAALSVCMAGSLLGSRAGVVQQGGLHGVHMA
mmetsp:Transcript_51188/g.141670  ORF Transcript_51188/g.141670 Transcript_51188/m.141670 type:complete len:307 (-) Transcript_51188:384-1304(-)